MRVSSDMINEITHRACGVMHLAGRSLLMMALVIIVSSGSGADRLRHRAKADPAPFQLYAAWPARGEINRLSDIGRGKAVIFSPDFSAPGNREFYSRLGFAYFEAPGWEEILDQIQEHNRTNTGDKIQAVILETHGTNGHGLKLQTGDAPRAKRSYISVGRCKRGWKRPACARA
jgi:hypothetical protein